MSIIADETTGVCDHSILNVIATVKGKPYLIGVVEMEACNHSTYSQAIISCASEAGISFQNITSIVSDSASYCKKAYRDVLSAAYPKSAHILCLAHIVNLAAEIFHHYKDFSHTANLTFAMCTWIVTVYAQSTVYACAVYTSTTTFQPLVVCL